MPTPTHDITLYQGLTFEGLQIILQGSTLAGVVQDPGTAYLCQVRTAPGKDLAFTLTVTRGTEADGQLLMPEVSAATTATFPLGDFVYDIVPIDTASKPWPPVLQGRITVLKSISVPT